MKKRILSLFVTICMALFFMPVISPPAHAATITAVKPTYGDGTAANPYKIATPGNMAWFRDKVNGSNGLAAQTDAYAILTADINMAGEDNWTPFATFRGGLDGRNHTISNWKSSQCGFFNNTYGYIKNLHIIGGSISSSGDGEPAAPIAYLRSDGLVYNFSYAGDINATGWGGHALLIGFDYTTGATVTDSYGSGTVNVSGGTYPNQAAAFLGSAHGNITFERCYSYGTTLTAGMDQVSGLVAYIGTGNAYFKNCYTDVRKTYNSRYWGSYGLFASVNMNTNGHAWFTNCFNYDPGDIVHPCNWVGNYKSSGDSSSFASLDNVRSTYSQYTAQQLFNNVSYFKNTANFSGWDFDNVWEYRSSEAYPTLRQRVDTPQSEFGGLDGDIVIYKGNEKTVNLTDYFNLVLAKDRNYKQDGRFEYSILEGATTTKQVAGNTFDENGEPVMEDVSYDVVSYDSGDIMTVLTDAGAGTYPVKIQAVDSLGKFDTFDFTVNVIVNQAVPAPKVLTGEFEYSRRMSLGMVSLTDGWRWSDPTICPKDTNTTGYEAYYQFDADAEYYDYSAVEAAGYTVTPYENEDGTHGIKVMLKVPVKRSEFSPWDVTFTVRDADTEAVISGAEISCDYKDEFPYENGNKSDANGIVEADMSVGEHNLTISASGYKPKSETVTIKPSNTDNSITLYLEPTRYTFKVPTVKLKDTEAVVAGARVTVTKISKNKTYAWNDKSDSIEVDASSDLDLPDGDFELRSSTYGYTTDDVIYIRVNRNAENESDRVIYYTDSKLSAKTTAEAGSVLHVVKMTEPMYYLEIDKSDTDDLTYTATVTLSNIKATFGTFGIRYDPALFTLDPDNGGVKLGSNISSDWNPTVEEYYGYDTDDNLKWKNENGYYTFVWSAGNKSNAVLDTEPQGGDTGEKEIVTFTFKLNGDDAKLADEITVDTFGIEPWDETKASKEFAKETAELDPDEDPLFWEHWRYVDKDNNKHTLQKGRIEESKSVVNGVETNGFFQASVNGSLGDTNPYSCYDVMTVLHYGFPIKNSIIKFHVTDADTDDDLKDVRLRLFDTGEKLFDSKYTNLAGGATFSVDTSGSNGTDFTYDALLSGYWPLPLSGLLKDRPQVAAETGKATEVEVKLKKKIYHVPQIKADDNQRLALVADADLGGEKYAYNGQDFHFRIKGAKGFRITEYPTKAYVTIGDSVTVELTHDENGLFKLDAEYLYQEPLGSDMFGAEGYEDFLAQPDAEGFRSYNIVVTFDKFETKELEYIVEGMTNENGTVEYTPNVPEAGGRPAEEDTDTYVKVKTQATQYSDPETKQNKIADANHLTGTFTFTGNDDYVVEKVYINGLLIDTYNGEKKFTYSFGTVDMDSSIIVMFWDGVNPSTDSVMTLVVGEYGSADVSSPVEEKDVSLTRRVYLNSEENLVFDTAPMNDDYRLCKVEKANEGSPRVEIGSEADGKYSVAPVEGESVTVYVTFRHKNAEITPNVFVKAYVYDGKGVINPAGILIYAMNDSPELELTADTKQAWKAKGVMISPYEDLDDVSEWDFDTLEDTNTYRYDSIKSDMVFGAIFVEKSYKLQGYVDLSQGSNVTTAAPKTGAIVTFMRVVDGEEMTKQAPVRTTTTAARTGAVFTVDLPAGEWNVYITKQGYLMYKITEFSFNPNLGDDFTYKFGQKDADTVQTVVPYIGSAKNGSRITLGDASVIKSGWRDHVNETVRAMADVDNDDKVSVKDMTYVMKNFNQRIVTQKYADFVEFGSDTREITED